MKRPVLVYGLLCGSGLGFTIQSYISLHRSWDYYTHNTQRNTDLFREPWDLRTEKSEVRKGVVRRPILVTEEGGLVSRRIMVGRPQANQPRKQGIAKSSNTTSS